MPPVWVSVLQLNSSYNYSKAVVFGMRISPLLRMRCHKKKRRRKQLYSPSSPQALAQTRCSTCTSLIELQKTKLCFGTFKTSLLSREAFP